VGSDRSKDTRPSHARQVLGSIVAAILIVVLTVVIVTAKIGPGVETRERREELEEIQDEVEDLQDEREELKEGS
jgi:cell shape-determining protein MreC